MASVDHLLIRWEHLFSCPWFGLCSVELAKRLIVLRQVYVSSGSQGDALSCALVYMAHGSMLTPCESVRHTRSSKRSNQEHQGEPVVAEYF